MCTHECVHLSVSHVFVIVFWPNLCVCECVWHVCGTVFWSSQRQDDGSLAWGSERPPVEDLCELRANRPVLQNLSGAVAAAAVSPTSWCTEIKLLQTIQKAENKKTLRSSASFPYPRGKCNISCGFWKCCILMQGCMPPLSFFRCVELNCSASFHFLLYVL